MLVVVLMLMLMAVVFGCCCGYGHVLVGWLPHRPRRHGPCIWCERKTGERGWENLPHTADSDNGMHRHCLDNMAPCHIVVHTLHRQVRAEPLGVVTWHRLLVVGISCRRHRWPVMVVGGGGDSGGWW